MKDEQCNIGNMQYTFSLLNREKNLWKQPLTLSEIASFWTPPPPLLLLPLGITVALRGELHIFFYSLGKEMKQQMEEQTTIFVQITYKSHKQVPRHIPVVPKHMADICTSEYLAETKFWVSARLKFIH